MLNHVCANNVDVRPGRIVYTQWLNARGGIEADLTVTRLAEDDYLIVTAAATEVRDFHWLQGHVPAGAHCVLTNVTSAMGVISIMGPNARELLQSLSPNDLSHEAFPFARAAGKSSWATPWCAPPGSPTSANSAGSSTSPPSSRPTSTTPSSPQAHPFGLAHAGYHALDSLRIEKAYRHWGHDITDEDTALEAGLDFAVKFDKPGGFIGREALLKEKEAGSTKRLLQFRLTDPEPLLYHNEPIWHDDTLVGYVTSGAYGHTLGGAIGLRLRRYGQSPGPAGGRLQHRGGRGARSPRRSRQGRCTTRGTNGSGPDVWLVASFFDSAGVSSVKRFVISRVSRATGRRTLLPSRRRG